MSDKLPKPDTTTTERLLKKHNLTQKDVEDNPDLPSLLLDISKKGKTVFQNPQLGNAVSQGLKDLNLTPSKVPAKDIPTVHKIFNFNDPEEVRKFVTEQNQKELKELLKNVEDDNKENRRK